LVTGTIGTVLADDTFKIIADGSYRLPDNFAGLEGPLTFPAGDAYAPIPITSEHQIRELRTVTSTSRPNYAAVVPVEFDPTVGQRFDLVVYPTPETSYVLGYTTNAMPDKLDATDKYPLGGMAHSETILESCLAIAEQRSDDESRLHRDRFASLMNSSIGMDRRVTAPENLGYNGENTDMPTQWPSRLGVVTYNSVLY
jgi:hypothetical protein